MTKTNRNFLLLFIVVTITLLYFLYKYNKIIHHNQIDILVSNKIEIVQKELTNQKNQALSLAILFSKNEKIINNLLQNNPNNLKVELLKQLNNIKIYTNQNNIQIQIHTKDLNVFVRSWEDKDSGLNLESFRKGLVKVKETQEPFVSNELGKRFNIKAIAPIFDNNDSYIGTIEVIMDYSDLKNRLKYMGIEIIPLLEKKYLNIAQYYKENTTLHDHIVIQEEYDKKLYDFLSQNKEYISNEKYYHENKDRIITQIPLGNIEEESVGFMMICFDKSEQNFNYLPRYEYTGEINSKSNIQNNQEKNKREIIIK